MSSNYFSIAFIPLILAQIICRLYLLRHLDQPADFTGAPWYVRLSLTSGMAKLFDLKETALFYIIGFIGFSVVFIVFINHFIIGSLVAILFILGIWSYWKAIGWMDEHDRWGTRKLKGEQDSRSTFQHLTKDSFLLFNSIAVVFLISVIGYFQLREYVRARGNEAGAKEAKEQLRQDSIRSLENK
jgi:hypothetical protein